MWVLGNEIVKNSSKKKKTQTQTQTSKQTNTRAVFPFVEVGRYWIMKRTSHTCTLQLRSPYPSRESVSWGFLSSSLILEVSNCLVFHGQPPNAGCTRSQQTSHTRHKHTQSSLLILFLVNLHLPWPPLDRFLPSLLNFPSNDVTPYYL